MSVIVISGEASFLMGGANVLYSMLSDNNRVLHVGVFVTVVRTDRLMDSSDTAAQPGDDSRWW